MLLADSVGQLRWWDHQIAAVSPVQQLWKRHSSPRTSLRTRSRTDDSLGIRTRQAAVRQLVSNFPRALSQCAQETLLTTARFHTAPSETSSSQNEKSIYSPSFAGPPRWHSRDAWSLETPRLGQKASKEHEWSPALGSALSLPLLPAPC